MKIKILEPFFSIVRLSPDDALPDWATQARPHFLARTDKELSIVCPEQNLPAEVTSDDGWRALELEGPMELTLTGVLSRILAPLAKAKISICAISTFDTDYVFVRSTTLQSVKEILEKESYEFVAPERE